MAIALISLCDLDIQTLLFFNQEHMYKVYGQTCPVYLVVCEKLKCLFHYGLGQGYLLEFNLDTIGLHQDPATCSCQLCIPWVVSSSYITLSF